MVKFIVKALTEGNMNGTPYWKMFAEEVNTKAAYKQSISATLTKEQWGQIEVGDIITDVAFRYTTQLKKGAYGEYYVQKLKVTDMQIEKSTPDSTPFPPPTGGGIDDPAGIRFA